MLVIQGKSVFEGIAIGTISFWTKSEQAISCTQVENSEAQWQRYLEAKEKTEKQLNTLYDNTVAHYGNEMGQIFEAYRLIVEDEEFETAVKRSIEEQKYSAEYAVKLIGNDYASRFSRLGDEYIQSRGVDVLNVVKRITDNLCGTARKLELFDKPVIVAAEDLSPSETVQMNPEQVLAFVTRYGSSNSHTAIMAGIMGIPALVQTEIDKSFDGKTVILDGYEGKLIVEPDEETYSFYMARKKRDDEEKSQLRNLVGKRNRTRSGKEIELLANIGTLSDLESVHACDAGGIGLFRSEFLYLGAEDFPSEEEQFEAYRKVVSDMKGKRVVVRTLDIGADKQAPYLRLDKEDNPELGFRAIRICLSMPEMFRTQLRALFRASAYGNLAILYPLVISIEEVHKIKAISMQVKEELLREGIPVGEVKEGIMIETPAAAIMSDELAKEVDFFSIGTNDLTQYTLAIDRENERLNHFFDKHHPAILKLIETVVRNGHKNNIPVGICGELAADTELTPFFLELDVDELSVSPGYLLSVRKVIREMQ